MDFASIHTMEFLKRTSAPTDLQELLVCLDQQRRGEPLSMLLHVAHAVAEKLLDGRIQDSVPYRACKGVDSLDEPSRLRR